MMPSVAHAQSTLFSTLSVTPSTHYHHFYQEYFRCSQCTHDFDCDLWKPVTLICGHTICRLCSKQLSDKCPVIMSNQQQQQCNTLIGNIDHLYVNYPLLKLLMANTKIDNILLISQSIDMEYRNCPLYEQLDEKSKSSFILTQQLLVVGKNRVRLKFISERKKNDRRSCKHV
ncbi:unnamed protein product, partial [Didymodactylos carnosus]